MASLEHRRRNTARRRRPRSSIVVFDGAAGGSAAFTTQAIPLLQGNLSGLGVGAPAITFSTQQLPLMPGFLAATDLQGETSIAGQVPIANIYRVLALADGFDPLEIPTDSIEISVVGIFRSTPITELRPSDEPVQVAAGGIIRTLDSGVTWSTRDTGFVQGSRILSVAYAPSDGNRVYCGSNSSIIMQSIDAGLTWIETATTPGIGGAINSIAVHPTDPDTLWVATSVGVAKSTDAGDTWVGMSSGLPVGSIPLSIVIDPNDASILYLAGITFGVFKSTNGGGLWVRATTGLPLAPDALNCRQLLITDSSTLYARIDVNGVWKTTDSAANWSDVSTGLSSLTTFGMDFDPTDILKLYVGSAGNIDRSVDGGSSWAAAGTGDGLPDDLGNYEVGVADDGNTIYAGITSVNAEGFQRVSKSVDDGVNWTDANDGFAPTVVQGFAAHPTIASQIIAFTDKDQGTGQETWVTVVVGTSTTISKRVQATITAPLETAGTLAADLNARLAGGAVGLRVQLVQVFRNNITRVHTLADSSFSRIFLPEGNRRGLIITALDITQTDDFQQDTSPIIIDRTQVTGAEVSFGFPEISMLIDPNIRVGRTIRWEGVDYLVRVLKYDMGRTNRLQTIGTRGVLSPTSTAENAPDVAGSVTQARIPRLRARPTLALTTGSITGSGPGRA